MRLILLIVTCFFALTCQAKCHITTRSCFKLNNQSEKTAYLSCWTEATATPHSQTEIQLSLKWGDGMGAPHPTQLDCKISFDNFATSEYFSFYNPYWGSVMNISVLPDGNHLSINLIDGWNSSKQIHYDIKLQDYAVD